MLLYSHNSGPYCSGIISLYRGGNLEILDKAKRLFGDFDVEAEDGRATFDYHMEFCG